MNTRKQQALETRKRIQDVLTDLLKTKKLSQITIQNICKEAGISVGAFYHHYASKEEVLGEAFGQFDQLTESHLMQKQYASTEEAIIDFLFNQIIFSQYQGVNYTREVLTLTLNPDAHNYFTDSTRFSRKYLKKLIEKAKLEYTLPIDMTASEIAELLQRHARGIGYDWVAHNGSYSLEDVLRKDLKILFNGLKADVQ